MMRSVIAERQAEDQGRALVDPDPGQRWAERVDPRWACGSCSVSA